MTDSKLTPLPDVQSSADLRNIPIDRVGVKGLVTPVQVKSADGVQSTVATIDMFVSLPADHKGTHMSRFVALVTDSMAEPLCPAVMHRTLQAMVKLLGAENGYVDVRFPFFVNKASPVSGLRSLMNYEARLYAERKDGRERVVQEVVAPVTSLCPCSKEISRYGAHNQRSHITISLELTGEVSLEEQVRIAETSASCELWARLKRGDEKFVTEYAYDHPKFVEDIIRDVARKVNELEAVSSYRIEVENFESIHNHSAYAMIERSR